MPTLSQFKILHKIGMISDGRRASARATGLQRAEEVARSPVYVPPVRKVFTLGSRSIDLGRLEALEAAKARGESHIYFPEMMSMAMLVSEPGKSVEDMSADDIMKRLHELGWRKQGEADRLGEARRRREEEKQRAEEEQMYRKREMLDLVNDPLLRRIKEKNQTVPKYSRAPDSRPFAICFDLLGPSVAHSTVKMKMDEVLQKLTDSDVKIVSFEYQPRAMHISGQNVGNRWVINLESQFGVSQLDGLKMTFGKQEVTLKPYDDVIGTEYKAFTRQSNFKKLFNME